MYQVDESAYWQAQLLNWGPKVLIAVLIIVATWIVARAVKWVLQKAIDKSPALRKHVTGTPEETIGHQLGVIAKLIIWLVGIMAALKFLGIGQILAPINALTLQIFDFLPRLLGAGLLSIAFWSTHLTARATIQVATMMRTAIRTLGPQFNS